MARSGSTAEAEVPFDRDVQAFGASVLCDGRPAAPLVTGRTLPAPRTLSAGRLANLPWEYTTGRFRALDHDFAVRTTDPALGRYLEGAFSALEDSGDPSVVYSFLDRGTSVRNRYAVYFQGERVALTPLPQHAFRYLMWHINHEVLRASDDRLVLVHASAAESAGQTLIFPAASGSGKTTLVAGLVRAGLRYVTDEAVAIDPSSGEVLPYPKPLALEGAAWGLFPELQPRFDSAMAPYRSHQWYVDPRSIHADAVAPRSDPRFVIAPRYRVGPTDLTPISKAEALAGLAKNAFNLERHGRRGFRVLASVIDRAECFALTVGDLDDACARVFDLLGTPMRPVPTGRRSE